MRFWTILCPLLLSVCSGAFHVEAASPFIEVMPTGTIHWTHGTIMAKGQTAPLSETTDEASRQGHIDQQARSAAAENLLQSLAGVRMDANRRASDVMATDEKIAARVAEMAQTAPVVETVQLPDGRLEIAVQMSLFGSFAQLMLPGDIKQVEPIRPFVTGGGSRTAPLRAEEAPYTVPDDPGVYTGLVVDARGIGAQPAMAPTLVDESGRMIYGSAFISRTHAVQHGVCLYARALEDRSGPPRVAPRPLWVKGLHTLPDRPCDIVISNADAARLRGASSNLAFLRACRVIILLD